MAHRGKVALISGILLTAGMIVPSVASAALSDCDEDAMCLWGNNDYEYMLQQRAAGNGLKNLSDADNNRMDSWANQSGDYVGCMYSGKNGTGDKQTMGKNKHDANVAPWNSDQVSSWRTAGGC